MIGNVYTLASEVDPRNVLGLPPERGGFPRVPTGRSYWRVVARWRTPAADDPVTFVAVCCGHLVVGAECPPDETRGDESYCGACGEMWTERAPAGHVALNDWEPGGRPTMRNVLLERLMPWRGVGMGDQWFKDDDGRWWRPEGGAFAAAVRSGESTAGQRGELMIRPFRGMRRARSVE